MISQFLSQFPPELINGFYAGAVALGISMLVTIHWNWLQSLRPANQLYPLAEDARWLSSRLGDILTRTRKGDQPQLDPLAWERLSTFIHKLNRLGIKHPDEVNDLYSWYPWLPSLSSWAETKNIKEARRYNPPKETGGSVEAS